MSKRQDKKDSDLMLNSQGLPSHSSNPNPPYRQGQQLMPMDPSTLTPTQRKRGRVPSNNMQGGGVAAASSSNMGGGGGVTGSGMGGHSNQGVNQGGFGDDVGEGSMSTQELPPSKRRGTGRTNTPWSPAEEQRLKSMRDAQNSWAEIAKTFPMRTEGSVKKHWYKDMHYAEFAEDESAALLNAIKDYETNKWKVIGQKVGKPAKACEQYAKEHFANRM